MKQSRSRQSGISFIGLLFVVGVLACAGVVAAQVLPTVVEYQAIMKAVQKASEGASVTEIKQIYQKAADVDNITSLPARDLDITKEGDKVVVRFAYNKEIHLVGPGYLVIKYAGESKPGR